MSARRDASPRGLAMRAVAVIGVVLALAPTIGVALDAPSPVGKSIVIDGQSMPTNGRVVTLDGNTVLFDGQPVIVDGKPLVVTGHDVTIDGRPVVRKGRFVSRPALLVFTVDMRWVGSSPFRMERDVTLPIERTLKTLPGVLDIHSTVVGSRAQTSLSFAPSTDPGTTESAIRLRIEQLKFRLPRDASRPLIAWRRDTAEAPSAAIAP